MAPQPKLTPEQAAAVRARAAQEPKPTQAQLAAEFGVSRNTIVLALAAQNTPAETLATPTGIIMLSTADILTSSLNPRKKFDEDVIAELAEGIAENGLLQNLVVRPDKNGFYTLVAGERRFRAIRLLESQGRWNEKFPCKVLENADDGTHLAVALLENLGRVDVSPLEEADAFNQLHMLDATKWSTANIAARIGKTQRYVQNRIAIATKLAPAAKLLMQHGKITSEGARLLSTVSEDLQTQILQAQDMIFPDEEDMDWDEISPLTPGDIQGQMNYFIRVAANEKEAQERHRQYMEQRGEVAVNPPLPTKAKDDLQLSKSAAGESPARPTALAKNYMQERWERDAAEHKQLLDIVIRLDTDTAPDEVKNLKGCSVGCLYAVYFEHYLPGDGQEAEWWVCTNPNSPRHGMLTLQDQASACFVPDKKLG